MALIADAASILLPAAGSASAEGLKPPTDGVELGEAGTELGLTFPKRKTKETFVPLESFTARCGANTLKMNSYRNLVMPLLHQ